MPATNTILSASTDPSDEGAVIDVAEATANQIDSDNTNERGEMPIYHFLTNLHREEGEAYLRTVTTDFYNAAEEVNYKASLETGRPVNDVFAIKSGDYQPVLLQKRLADKGKHFRLTIVDNKSLKLLGDIAPKVQRATFAWANPSYSFFLNVEGETEFGLGSMGIGVKHDKKTSKRLQEIGRFTAHSLYTEDDDFMFVNAEDAYLIAAMPQRPAKWIIGVFETPEGHSDEDFDGSNYYGPRMNSALGLDKGRKNGRILMDRGLYKGDFMYSPHLGVLDMIVWVDNRKEEIWADTPFMHITMESHADMHVAQYDKQSSTNHPQLLPVMSEYNDIVRLGAEARAVIEEFELPKWLNYVEKAHVDTGGIMEADDGIQADFERWFIAGRQLEESNNLLNLGFQHIPARMETGWNKRTKFYRKMFLPMSNAVLASVVTYSSATLMGGFEFGEHDGSKNFFVPGLGMVVPDHRFKETFELHGTWDQDDTAKYRRIMVWCSHPNAIKNLVKDGVIDGRFEIPTTPEEAIEMAAVIRSPNGPGEYSIEHIAGEVPWFGYHDDVDVIDLATLPRGLGRMMRNVNKLGLSGSDNLGYGGAMEREHALYMIEAQMANPGIGRLANALMAWADVMGPSYPAMMVDDLGAQIDAVQQVCDKDLFAQVEVSHTLILEQLADAMAGDPSLRIDKSLFMERLAGQEDEFMGIIEARMDAEKRPTKMSNAYRALYVQVKRELSGKTLEIRSQTELVAEVQKIVVGKDVSEWAKNFYFHFRRRFQDIDEAYEVKPKDHTFVKISKGYFRSDALKEVVAEMVNELQVLGEPRWVVGLYKWITKNGYHKGWPHGRYDRIMFQSAGAEVGVVNLLIEGLASYGI